MTSDKYHVTLLRPQFPHLYYVVTSALGGPFGEPLPSCPTPGLMTALPSCSAEKSLPIPGSQPSFLSEHPQALVPQSLEVDIALIDLIATILWLRVPSYAESEPFPFRILALFCPAHAGVSVQKDF